MSRFSTSKEIIVYQAGIVSSLSLSNRFVSSVRPSVFRMLFSDLLDGVNSLFKYLANSKDAVSILGITGLAVSSSSSVSYCCWI